MRSKAKLTVRGYLGNDAELKQVGERSVLNFSIAATKSWKNQDGSTGEKTVWIRCAVWGKHAEILHGLGLVKGLPVEVEGWPSVRAYLDQSGQPQASLELTCDEVELLTSKKDGGPTQPAPNGTNYEEVEF